MLCCQPVFKVKDIFKFQISFSPPYCFFDFSFKLKFPIYKTFVFPDDNFCFLKVTTFDFGRRAGLVTV